MEAFFWAFGGVIVGFGLGQLLRIAVENRKEKLKREEAEDRDMGITRLGGYH